MRTNPRYHEASPKVIEAGERMAFDTDLIGAYGLCVDMSLTWLCLAGRPTGEQLDLMVRAQDTIARNTQFFALV